MTLQKTIKEMTQTYQLDKKITVLDHGQMVKERLWDLINLLEGKTPVFSWKLPDNFHLYHNFLKNQLYSRSVLYLYTVMHDCGKPLCRIKDEKG